MIIVTANLGRGVSAKKFAQVVTRLRVALKGMGAVIGFQEIDEADAPDEHRRLRKVFRRHTWAGWDTRVPIAIPPHWRIVEERVVPAAKGLFGLSPHRVITEALIENPKRPNLPPIVIICVHYPRWIPALFSRWGGTFKAHKARVQYWAKRGITAISLMDANKAKMPRLHRLEKTLTRGRIDYARCVEGSVEVEVIEEWVIKIGIDGHNARCVRVRLSPALDEENQR